MTDTTTKVYKYGLRAPILNGDIVDRQLRLGHQYRNVLIEQERARRQKIREAQSSVPSIAALEFQLATCVAEIDALYTQIKSTRGQDRKRTKVPPELRARKKELLAQKKELCAELRTAKQAQKETLQPLFAAIEDESNAQRRAARKAFSTEGLYWGTYLLIEAAMDQSRKEQRSFAPEKDPPFRRWTGRGYIGLQLQKGLAADYLFSDDRRLRIDPVSLQVDPNQPTKWRGTRSTRRRGMRTQVWLRVGSAKRDPVWAVFPMWMHRPLPPGAVIKWAKVVVEMLGERRRYSLHLTVVVPTVTAKPSAKASMVGLDVGWRKMPDGSMRICAWHGVDEWSGANDCPQEFRLPAKIFTGLQKVRDLRSIRDKRRDQLTPTLIAWLQENILPPWLSTEADTITQWKSQARFRRLWAKWRDHRLTGDAEIFETFTRWRNQDKHLLDWQVNQLDRINANRREQYRVFAARLAEHYTYLVLEDFRLTDVNRKAPIDADAENPSNVIYCQNTAAISVLRDSLINAFRARGGDVIFVPPENTTRECHRCGTINRWNQAVVVVKTCVKCGSTWDQDANAAINILVRGVEKGPPKKKKKKTAQPPKGKWQRRKEAKETPDDETPDDASPLA